MLINASCAEDVKSSSINILRYNSERLRLASALMACRWRQGVVYFYLTLHKRGSPDYVMHNGNCSKELALKLKKYKLTNLILYERYA